MTRHSTGLKVLLYTDFDKGVPVADMSAIWTGLRFSTALHGGFKDCHLEIPMTPHQAWQWLQTEHRTGYHFYHLEISEDQRIVWEGRIMDIELRVDAEFYGISVDAYGYWSACRDRYYDAQDAGNTDWTVGGPHQVSKIIKELLTKSCPDINSDQAGIDANSADVVGIDLTARAYPQDIVVDKLAPLSDSDDSRWYFAIWEDRKPFWKKRAVNAVDWYVWMRDTQFLRVSQSAIHMRNNILPVVGTAEGTGTTDGDSTALYPRRELMLLLPSGVTSTIANDARDAAVADRRHPSLSQGFSISGHVYSTRAAPHIGTAADGALVERPKWWVRAGDVLRVQDLVPASIDTPSLDRLRTVYIVETSYDAVTDALTVQPDRTQDRLDIILPRITQLERDK